MKELAYNGEMYCVLEDGSVEPLFYGPGRKNPRRFYRYGKEWYLDHDRVFSCGIAYCHSRIVKFLEKRP